MGRTRASEADRDRHMPSMIRELHAIVEQTSVTVGVGLIDDAIGRRDREAIDAVVVTVPAIIDPRPVVGSINLDVAVVDACRNGEVPTPGVDMMLAHVPVRSVMVMAPVLPRMSPIVRQSGCRQRDRHDEKNGDRRQPAVTSMSNRAAHDNLHTPTPDCRPPVGRSRELRDPRQPLRTAGSAWSGFGLVGWIDG